MFSSTGTCKSTHKLFFHTLACSFCFVVSCRLRVRTPCSKPLPINFQESGETFKRCGDNVMKAHALDQAAVDKCIKDSFVTTGGANKLLHQEIVDRSDYGVLKLPEAVVNGVVLRGQTSYGATLEMNVAQAICNGFLDGPPAACQSIIHPDGSLGQEGKATVSLQASMGFVSGSELTVAGLTETIISRFRSTLALKLGVEPQAIEISSDTKTESSNNKVMVMITIRNLKCPTEESKASSAKILDSLKGVATCKSEASSDTAVEDETGVGTIYYFHTSSAHSSQSRQIKAVVTSMSADESNCPVPSGLAAVWVVLIVVVCCLVIFGGFFFFWRRRMESQMRDEVKAILQTYMPLDDAVDFSSGETDQARMLDGNPSSSMEMDGRI